MSFVKLGTIDAMGKYTEFKGKSNSILDEARRLGLSSTVKVAIKRDEAKGLNLKDYEDTGLKDIESKPADDQKEVWVLFYWHV